MVKEIVLDPNYINVTDFFANNLAEHGFDKGFLGASITLMETVRYLQDTDPQGLEDLLIRLRRKHHQREYGDGLYVKYCDSYDSVTQTCSHSKPSAVLPGVTVITAEGTAQGDLMSDDSIRMKKGG